MGGIEGIDPGDCLPPNCPARVCSLLPRSGTWNLRFQRAGCCQLHHKALKWMQELGSNQPLSDSESERLANRPSCNKWLPRQGLNLRPFA